MNRFKKISIYLITGLIAVNISYTQSPQWRTLPSSPSFGRYDDLYFINPTTGWVANIGGRVYKTTDGGNSWQMQLNLSTGAFRSIGFFNEMNGVMGTLDSINFLYKTTNSGLNWTVVQNVPNPKPTGICGLSIVNDFVVYGSGKYYGTPRVIKSTDRGNTWITIDMSPYCSVLIDCYFRTVDSGFVVGGTGLDYPNRKARILFTSNGGQNWVNRYTSVDTNRWCWKISFPSVNTGYVSVEGNNILYCLKTTNKGVNWIEVNYGVSGFSGLGIGFATEQRGWLASPGPLLETTDGGISWQTSNFGSSVNRIHFLSDTLGYAGGSRIYKYSITPIGIQPISNEIPEHFSLSQNFPNPFNPNTIIRFKIKDSRLTTVKVFDILGREVATLVNEKLQPGTYEADWDATNYPSGVYYYKLIAGDYFETKKMVLIK